MSLADKAGTLTPLMHLQRRKRAARIFALLLTLGMIGLAGTILFVNDGRNYKRLAEWLGVSAYVIEWPAAAAPPAPTSRYRRIVRTTMTPPRLTAPAVTTNDAFRPQAEHTAYERCKALGVEGEDAPTFQAAGSDWECLFSLEVGPQPEPSVLFVQIRGQSSGTFRTFRLKLSLLSPGSEAVMIDNTLGVIDRFGLPLSPESRSYIEAQLKARQDFSSILENYRISFDRERDDGRRFNLIVTPRLASDDCTTALERSDGARMHSTTVQTHLSCQPLRPRIPGRPSNPLQPD